MQNTLTILRNIFEIQLDLWGRLISKYSFNSFPLVKRLKVGISILNSPKLIKFA